MLKRIYYFENTSYNSKTGNHHNKFYRMIELDNGKFLAEWGSIGKNPLGTKEYSMNEWYNIQTKKENKGYIFGNDPGNTTCILTKHSPASPTRIIHYDLDKVNSVKNRIQMVIELLAEKDVSELEKPILEIDKYRVQGIYNEFNADPGTFTPTRIKEINEIYNRFRQD